MAGDNITDMYPIEPFSNKPSTYASIKVSIETFVITDAGSFNDQVIRPHTTTSDRDVLNQFVQNVQGAVSRNAKITPTLLSNNVGNIVMPSTYTEQSIPIPNGWHTNRLRFFLKVRMLSPMSNSRIGYFQGYTEFSDMSMNGLLDPSMTFFINSFAIVEETMVNTPNGNFMMPRLIESSNILPPTVNMPGPYTSPSPYLQPDKHLLYMRPNDIFSSIQVSHIHEIAGGTTYDFRTDPNTYIKSYKSNNNPGSYMSYILNSYIDNTIMNRNAPENSQFDGVSTILEQCINQPEEHPLTDNPFLRELAKIHGASFRAVTHFNLKMLSDLDPDLQHKLKYVKPTRNMISNLPQVGDSEYWNGQTREVVAATLIMNSLSSILFENMISSITIASTNMTMNREMVTSVTGAISLTGLDASPYLQAIVLRLEKDILSSITFNNADAYKLVVNMDLFGVTRIEISLSGGPVVPFTAPTFADSLYSPVSTFDPRIKNNLTKDIDYALDAVSMGISRPLQPTSGGRRVDSSKFDF